jgi:predicted kinase
MWRFTHTPAPPEYRVDWQAIDADFAWVRAMRDVRQEPQWHAEGDVHTHTRMVCEAMAADADWRSRPVRERHALFASALLHDVAKPACTRFEDGRWTSPRHAKIGEGMARNLMRQGMVADVPPPFDDREFVAKLVRHHGLPLRFMDKPDPGRACVEASLEVDLRAVAALALAYVRGRDCAEKGQLLERINLFAEYCRELACWEAPRRFESDHHRFMYCVGRKPLEYVPYDDTWGEVVLMSGLPGSGKSTHARRLAEGRPVINLDELRDDLGVEPGEVGAQGAVVNAAKEEAKRLLRGKTPFVWDATNITRELRAGLTALFANYGARVRIVYVEASWQETFARNRARQRPVPERAIAQMADRLEVPSRTEAHRVDYVIAGSRGGAGFSA